MGTELKELLDISSRIINNLNTLKNNTVTSEMPKKIDEVNQQLSEQQKLLNQTNVKQIGGETNKTLQSNISQQQQLVSELGFNQKTTSGVIDQSLDNLADSNDVFDQVQLSAKNTVAYNQVHIQQLNAQTRLSTSNFGTRSAPDMGEALKFTAMANWKNIANAVGTGLEWIPFFQYLGKGIKLTVEAAQELVNAAVEVAGMANQFADRLEDFTSRADEAFKSTLQQLGIVSVEAFGKPSQAGLIKKNILTAGAYMVQQVGIAFGPEQIADFQKAYAEISKTSLSFSDTDYVTMGEIQKTLDLSSQESAELANMFINMGVNVTNVGGFVKSIMSLSSQAGVNSRDVIKDMKDYFKSSQAFKLGSSLQDMARIMTFAKRIKVDLGGMLDLMNSVADPQEAIDLGMQLQALSTDFLNLEPVDLLGASLTNVEAFTKMITDPIRDHINKYFDIRSGQMTFFGKQFSDQYLKMKGVNKVFKSEVAFTEFLARAGKRGELQKAINNSLAVYSGYISFTPDEQDLILDNLAANIQGNGLEGTIMSLGNKKLKNLNTADFKTLLDPNFNKENPDALKLAAEGTVSDKEKLDVNKLMIESMSWTADAIKGVNDLLTSKDYRETLGMISNTVMDVGTEVFENTDFKNMHLLADNLKLTVAEAYIFGDYLVDNAKTGVNILSEALKQGMAFVSYANGGSPNTTTPSAITPQTQSVGGLIDVPSVKIPTKSLQSSSKYISASGNNAMLSDLLSSFMTNQFGPGVISQMGSGGTTKIVVSGEIRNIINNKDAGALDGEKVLKILEKQLV